MTWPTALCLSREAVTDLFVHFCHQPTRKTTKPSPVWNEPVCNHSQTYSNGEPPTRCITTPNWFLNGFICCVSHDISYLITRLPIEQFLITTCINKNLEWSGAWSVSVWHSTAVCLVESNVTHFLLCLNTCTTPAHCRAMMHSGKAGGATIV